MTIKTLISTEAIEARIVELGKDISADYEGKDPILIGVLKGAAPFVGRLITNITGRCQLDFISAYSYFGEQSSSGVVRINKDIDTPIEGRHVIVADDVLDTGRTLIYLINFLKQHKPASIELCVLVRKKIDPPPPIRPKYEGFVVPNVFLVGYGLDFHEHYRNLPYIGTPIK